MAQQAKSCNSPVRDINERLNGPKQLGPKQLGLDRSPRIQIESQQSGGGLQNSEQAYLGPLRKQPAVNPRGCNPNTQELPTADSKRKNNSNQTKSYEGRLENLVEGLFNHKRSGSFLKLLILFLFWPSSCFGGVVWPRRD